jgi:hypothetical protein
LSEKAGRLSFAEKAVADQPYAPFLYLFLWHSRIHNCKHSCTYTNSLSRITYYLRIRNVGGSPRPNLTALLSASLLDLCRALAKKATDNIGGLEI